MWPLTLAWPPLTTFVAPLVAATVYQSYVGLTPGLPLLFTKRLIGTLDLGLGWDLDSPLGACSRRHRPYLKAEEPGSSPSYSLCGTLDILLQIWENLSHYVLTFILCTKLSPISPPGTPITHMLDSLILSQRSLRLYSLFFNMFLSLFFT